jgi:hypothetical protein
LLVEEDLEKELDPQMAAIDDRLERIERLLERLQPDDVKARVARFGTQISRRSTASRRFLDRLRGGPDAPGGARGDVA